MTELPQLIYADKNGNIYEESRLTMLCRKGKDILLPKPGDLIPLPKESDIFLLPDRRPMGFDKQNGRIEILEDAHAVAGFVCPGYTLTGIAAYKTDHNTPSLPLFAYGAIGYYKGKFWVCAKKVDNDPRQKFSNIKNVEGKIHRGVKIWMEHFPENRLFAHLTKCALKYNCPAAKNLALGRYEAPLPTSPSCNAKCIGCISKQPPNSDFPSTQKRINFVPTPSEITEVMLYHSERVEYPILSFGQGCEGEPLLQHNAIKKAINIFKKRLSKIATVNINTNGSLPEVIPDLAKSGLTSIRVSINSFKKQNYMNYYRPSSYEFEDVLKCIEIAKEYGLFVSLNYLFFPGINDKEDEFDQLLNVVAKLKVDMIQLRNLNLDPELYLKLISISSSPYMGLKNFIRRLKKECPWIIFGYFNPFVTSS